MDIAGLVQGAHEGKVRVFTICITEQTSKHLWNNPTRLKGHSQLMHMCISYNFIVNLHITERCPFNDFFVAPPETVLLMLMRQLL